MKNFYLKYEKYWPTVFFLLGVIYDIATLDPIDSLFAIARQGIFLLIVAGLLAVSVFVAHEKWHPQGRLGKMWSYHEVLVHFLLGGLLSEYTLFFLKSASLWSSSIFLLLLAALILINEFKQVSGHSGIPLRTALLTICLVSYFVSVVPLVLGFVGTIPFLLSILISSGIAWAFLRYFFKRMPENIETIKRRLGWPVAGVVIGFLVLYFTKLIPPIPIRLEYAGIYHEIIKESGEYNLSFDKRGSSYFQNGAKVFIARPGDRPHFFVRIYSPARINDNIQLRWMFKTEQTGWETADVIPMSITGGRVEGFRGFSYKSNYQPGDWQVRVETSDSREIGRLYFAIESDEAPDSPRYFSVETH